MQEKFRADLLVQSDDFKKQVLTVVDDFHEHGPFAAAVGHMTALAQIAAYKDQLGLLRHQEDMLRKGLFIFKIDLPPSSDIAKLDNVNLCLFRIFSKCVDAVRQIANNQKTNSCA